MPPDEERRPGEPGAALKSSATTTSSILRSDAALTEATFADVVLGDRPGFVAVAFGYGGHWIDGKYKHKEWVETRFSWPAERRRMDTEIQQVTVGGDPVDVYVCPAVRHTNDRRKGSALPPMVCWVDLDGDPVDRDLWKRLRPYVVASGRPGHRHVYVPLTRPVDLGTHALLNRALTDRLGGDNKWSDESLLRMPETFNYKTAPPVRVDVQSRDATTWDPDHLAALLGVDNDVLDRGDRDLLVTEQVDLDALPVRLKERLADTNVEDRSAAFHGLVGGCQDAGLTKGQTAAVMAAWKPGVDKYGARLAAEVARSWGKVDPVGDPAKVDPARYFDKSIGLLVATLADDIIAMGPIAHGLDDISWSYTGGVWIPDRYEVRARAAHLLGERFRRTHSTNVEDVVKARSPAIRCDPVPEFVNFRNGLYAWQADLLQEHTPDVLSTVQLSIDYDPHGACPEFDRFLSQVLPADMVDLMWELIGYLMYSGNPLHKAIMLTGSGRNGKGTLLRVVNALLGVRNVTSVSLHDLVNTRFSTASLFGKIANIAGDIDGKYLESTATFKAITGQDVISAEHKGRDRFDFTPWAVPVFSANKIPASSDVTTGYLSRWVVVPFPNDFTGHEDRKLDQRLQTKAELQGIAAKTLPALRRLMDRGEFDLPESGIDARDEFTRRVDQVRTWVDECTEIDHGNPFTARTSLYRDYKTWASRDGHKPVKAGEFYDRLATIPGCEPGRLHSGERGFTGIRVTDHAEDGWWRR